MSGSGWMSISSNSVYLVVIFPDFPALLERRNSMEFWSSHKRRGKKGNCCRLKWPHVDSEKKQEVQSNNFSWASLSDLFCLLYTSKIRRDPHLSIVFGFCPVSCSAYNPLKRGAFWPPCSLDYTPPTKTPGYIFVLPFSISFSNLYLEPKFQKQENTNPFFKMKKTNKIGRRHRRYTSLQVGESATRWLD